MKAFRQAYWIVSFMAASVAALAMSSPVTASQGSNGGEVLTNESVVQMIDAKVPKDLVLAKIQSTSTAFDVSANALVALYQRKVPKDTIKAMLQATAGNPASHELMTNQAIVYMVTNGLPRDLIISKVQSGKAGYDLTTAGLVSLNQNKVSQEVVKAMMASTAVAAPSSPATVSPPQSSATATPSTIAVSPPTGQPNAQKPETGDGRTAASPKKQASPEKKTATDKKDGSARTR